MGSWNIEELRTLIRESSEIDRKGLALDLGEAIIWKLMAIKHHLGLANDAFKPYFSDGEVDTIKAAQLFSSKTIEANNFNHAIAIREISLVAAITTAHTIPEIIAQLITLLFFKESKDVSKISFDYIIKELPDNHLKNRLVRIKGSHSYQYVSAFTNITKHLNLVKPIFLVDFRKVPYHGVVFKEFEYRGKKYPDKQDTQLMEMVRSLSLIYLDAVIQINETLKSIR